MPAFLYEKILTVEGRYGNAPTFRTTGNTVVTSWTSSQPMISVIPLHFLLYSFILRLRVGLRLVFFLTKSKHQNPKLGISEIVDVSVFCYRKEINSATERQFLPLSCIFYHILLRIRKKDWIRKHWHRSRDPALLNQLSRLQRCIILALFDAPSSTTSSL